MNTFCTISDYYQKNQTIENTKPKTPYQKEIDRYNILMKRLDQRIEQYAKERFDKNFGYTIEDYK